jgi:hypothetical protein
VSEVLKGKKSPGDSICRALGYERQPVTYVSKDIWDKNKP